MKLFRLATIVALGCGWFMPASAQDAELATLIAAAKKEGKVTFYTSALGQPFHAAIAKAFEDKYGVTVELLDVRASELRERVRTEQASGRFIGDVMVTGAATMFRQLQEGQLQPHGVIPNAKYLRSEFPAPDDVRVPYYVHAYGILVNTNLVKPADEPKSWKDLLDPKWKDKMLADDFRALGGGQVWFHAATDKFGKEYQERLAAQNIIFSRDIGNDEKRVARGEYPLRLPQTFSNYVLMKGLPVKLIVPEEGAAYIQFQLTVLKNAPHPNAARLFINHLLSEESQLVYAANGLLPVRIGVVEKSKPDIRELAGAKLMGTTSPETQEAMLNLAKQIYK
jgi:iron(III) transport system substrate-binding protein